jgi:hypothetical protein
MSNEQPDTGTPTTLTKEQRRRQEAVEKARTVLAPRGLTATTPTAEDVIQVADYILHGKVGR